MASRNSQGLLFTVIILTIMMFICGGLAVWMFMTSNELSDQLTLAKQKTTEAEARERTWIQVAEICKAQVGTADSKFGEMAGLRNSVNSSGDQKAVQTLKSLDDSYNAIVGQKINTDDNSGANPTYLNVVESLSSVLSVKHNELAEANNRYTTLQSQTKIDIAEKDEEIASITKKFNDATDKLKTATNDFTKTIGELKKANDENQVTIAEAGNKQTQLISDYNKVKTQLETEKQQLAKTVTDLQDRLKQLTGTNNVVPDGRIISVDNRGKFVQVNLGKADRLRIKQTFLVFDRSETNFETARPKATIEVTSVAGDRDHISDARISEANAGDPILPGDHILSPTWDPGYQVPIAIAGFIDLDGDGKSDRVRFEGMVRQNGGVIVAYHDEEGIRRGEIDANTRYLVTGTINVTDKAKLRNISDAFTYYRNQAQQYRVEELSVRRFIELMGVKFRPAVTKMDHRIGTNPKEDFVEPKKFRSRSAFGDK